MPQLAFDLTKSSKGLPATLPISKIRKFDADISQIEDIIKLTVGEPDLSTPMHIKQAAIKDIEADDSHYADFSGKKELRDAISNYLKTSLNVDYDPETEICVSVGATGALNAIFMSILNPGDKVLIPTPAWGLYFQIVRLAGGQPVQIDTSKDDFILTADKLIETLEGEGKGAKAILITDPSNPTGRVYSPAALQEIAKVISDYHLLSITDEIYAELIYDKEKHHSLSQYIPERNVILSGVSKAFAMTGWRLGYIAGPSEIMELVKKVNSFLFTSVTNNVQIASAEALNNGQADTKKARDIYGRRRNLVMDGLAELGFKLAKPQGAFYIFAKFPERFGTDDVDFAYKLAQEAKVGLTPGSYFGKGGQGYIRLSYASSIEQLELALVRIKTFINNN
ncbi:aspartate transaminase [Lactobacillus pasteurii DSM 23907 = CRBIP 24.76]|uniref:Aminotransferase n=1 Tax=Lactobacillus pasteurii DSM 23907 = CRBIP 24.76 TaxID=1423790 RepID=I7JYK0_9LACO|nr:aminotransferase class I/II-fold pyridoxal phosphate-dependent enzyme [Lactobacillus pasteurii]KRK08522.1 aspartate transaminase [Lactobacillus pasteurii DSM 23907 = CRBIP 24.76]TDG75701.1 hypothetical protein C5L33_000586 [Lactobacillus pasteurii]CCI85615.1 Aspartate aminotransferase [Lactobacillus pasteurii DSM 23907 = CRBIP 24.76]